MTALFSLLSSAVLGSQQGKPHVHNAYSDRECHMGSSPQLYVGIKAILSSGCTLRLTWQ